MGLKIQSVEAFPIKIPDHPYLGGHGADLSVGAYGDYIRHAHYRSIYTLNAETMLVRITTDEGIVGWGETQCALVPDIVAQLVRQLVAPGLIGEDPFQRQALRDRIYDHTRDRGHDAGFMVDAIHACDIALWDLCGKAEGKPVHQLLGGALRDKLPCYVSGVPARSIEEQIEKIHQWMSRGFHRFKISLGFGVHQDLDHVGRLRKELGGEIDIFIDAHWAYTVAQAIELGRGLESLDVGFLECPVDPEDIEGQSKVAAAIGIPLALGEEYRTHYHFRLRILRKAVDLPQPDIGRLGITEGLRVIEACAAAELPVAPHIGQGQAVYTSATLHLAAVAPTLRLVEYQPTQVAIANDFYSPSLEPIAGEYQLSAAPGLGVEPDLEKLAPYIVG